MEINKQDRANMLKEPVREYANLFSTYSQYADTLIRVFEKASKKYAPLAIVQARPKSISSFAEKILRKNKYTDPVRQITDLCGARIITHIPEEVAEIGKFIKNNFIVDEKNSVDVNERLKPTEFGYRSVHYVVQFKEGAFPNKDVNIEIPKELFSLKAEIQVRTILEHSWADFSHDLSYKGAFKIPQKWERELAGLAASLESADKTYSRVHSGLKIYAGNFGAYMSIKQIKEEIKLQELILEINPDNFEVAHHIGKLAIEMGDWQKAIQILSKFAEVDYQPLIRDLGLALCRQNEQNRDSQKFQRGQKYLETACASASNDIAALCYLASTYRGVDNNKVNELCARAFAIDSTEPYALGSYLESELICRKDISAIPLVTPLIEAAIGRSKNQAEVGVNIQWVFYDIGRFYLLLGKPYESLSAYAKAIQLSVDEWLVQAALESINRLGDLQNKLPGYEWVRKLLLIGLAAKFPKTDAGIEALRIIKQLASTGYSPIEGPVVIVAGRCNTDENQTSAFKELMMEAFRDFEGTIISGGTNAGISGLVGDVQQKYVGRVKTIGYIPASNKTAQKDPRYNEIRLTNGEEFSAAEPLQYLIDLLNSGINISQVKLLGIDGEKISAVEYRMAIALGASTAIVEDSQGAAEKLLADPDWNKTRNLIAILNDPLTVWAFIQSGFKKLKPNELREQLGQKIHENYLVQASKKKSDDPSLEKWPELIDYLRESNRLQADHILEKLNRINCTIHKVTDRKIALMEFSDSEILTMAQMEHARWNVERLLDGWKKSPDDTTKDVRNKITPYIKQWAELSESVRNYDIEAVKKIPEVLASVSFEVVRLPKPKPRKRV